MLVHSKMLQWLARPLLPKGWTAGGFKTSGDVEAQRVSLQTLGNRLAGLGIFSFLCKCVSSATSYFARDVFAPASGHFKAIMFLATTLTVQAIPSAMTLLLLSRFHFSGGAKGKACSCSRCCRARTWRLRCRLILPLPLQAVCKRSTHLMSPGCKKRTHG